ncbi:MAG: hypothetical protein FWB90_09115 [Fibromonadales bacterium]|nr:hypothetical protein [Fibromonadales bacterium]
MKTIIKAFKNMPGIFSRVLDLRNDPLIAEFYEPLDKIDTSRYSIEFQYRGIERDVENWRKDKANLARDFNKAFQAAKVRLGV